MLPPSAYHRLRIVVEVEIAPEDVENVRQELADEESIRSTVNRYLYDAESALYSQDHPPRLTLRLPDKKGVMLPIR